MSWLFSSPGSVLATAIWLRIDGYLFVGVAALDHSCDEVVVFLLILLAGLGVEADDRQQILGVGEHFLLDDHPQLLVAEPGGVLAIVVGSCPQDKVDDFVAEVFRVADARRLFDLLQLFVEGNAIEDFAGFRVAVFLILNPEVRVEHVTVEDILAVLAFKVDSFESVLGGKQQLGFQLHAST